MKARYPENDVNRFEVIRAATILYINLIVNYSILHL